MRKTLCGMIILLLLAGCANLQPVGHDTAKWHGERHLDILKHPNGRRY